MCSDKFSPAHRLFLSKFVEPRALSDGVFASSHWSLMLGETLEQAAQRLADAGFLVQASVHQKFAYLYTVNELKEMLRLHGLSTSGNKGELIDYLILNAKDKMQSQVNNVSVLVCSDSGREFVENYKVSTNKIQTINIDTKRRNKALSWIEDVIAAGVIGNAVYDVLSFVFRYIRNRFQTLNTKFEKTRIINTPRTVAPKIHDLMENVLQRIRRLFASFMSEVITPIMSMIKRWRGF
jgi:hypothetical protein